jgi:hypothetical protein
MVVQSSSSFGYFKICKNRIRWKKHERFRLFFNGLMLAGVGNKQNGIRNIMVKLLWWKSFEYMETLFLNKLVSFLNQVVLTIS